MLRASIAFFILGIIALALGAGNIAGVSIEIGKTILFIFTLFAVLGLVVSLVTGRSSKLP